MAETTLVITGPTASGKSALALAVAQRIGGEIISMDSRQVYRGLDIGTAKPAAADLLRVPHHGLDLIEPSERYSAGQFARDAHGWIDDIRTRGRVPVVTGGTLFFLRALEEPLFDEPPMDPVARERLRAVLAELPLPRLQQWAATVSGAADRLPPDPQRLARLIEVATLTGQPLSWWHAATAPSPGARTTTFVMALPRAELYRRIDDRVHRMIEQGLVQEVRDLVALGYGSEHPGMKTTGYLELLPYVHGQAPLEDAITTIQAVTRRYARRQLTWLRTQVRAAHELDALRPTDELADQVVAHWREEEA